jgi:predicted PurR-regulated permease PerM
MSEPAIGPVTRNAIVLMAVVICGAAIWWLREILTPLVLALFLMVLIDGLARVLQQRIPHFPQRAATPVAIILSIVLFAVTVYLMVDNTTAFIGQLVDYGPKLHAAAARVAGQFGFTVPPTLAELLSKLNPGQYAGVVAQRFQNFAQDAVFVLIYLGFLIAARSGFGRKIVILFPGREQREHATHLFARVRTGVERYVWVQTITGLMIAGLAWAIMAGVGLNNALFWAFFIFIASYIPMIGAAVSILLPALFALVQFDTYWQALVVLAGLEIVFTVVGNMVLPKMQGDSLNLDPVVILLSLAFWSAIWGLPGAFLSSPLTVMAMVILVQFPATRWIAVLLSENGDPELDRDNGRKPRSGPPQGGAAPVT